jgi:hypothetical protein
MTALNIVNFLFVFVGGYFAVQCFQEGRAFWGWFNVFASAMNVAAIALAVAR